MTQTSWTAIVERELRERRWMYAIALILLAAVVAISAAVISPL